jgi:hypothetical protein
MQSGARLEVREKGGRWRARVAAAATAYREQGQSAPSSWAPSGPNELGFRFFFFFFLPNFKNLFLNNPKNHNSQTKIKY